jgi:hypothetical protein
MRMWVRSLRIGILVNHLRATALSFDDSSVLITSVLKDM